MECFYDAQITLIRAKRNTQEYYQKTVAMYNRIDFLTVDEGFELLIEVTKNFFIEKVEIETVIDEAGLESEEEVIKQYKIDERMYIEEFLSVYTQKGWIDKEKAQLYTDKLNELYPIESSSEKIDDEMIVEV